MKNLYVLIVLIFLSSCSPTLKQSFSKLSKPERTWVTFHPFKSKTAFMISREALKVKDSIAINKGIGTDNSGGKLDAFKHSYWMARLTQDIGKSAANRLGKAHEKGNYQTYKKKRLEDGLLPDKQSSDMDLFNNQIGIEVGTSFKKSSRTALMRKLIDALEKGNLRVLKKDSLGNFLDCQNKKIPLDSLKNKWDTKKCLVSSNVTF